MLYRLRSEQQLSIAPEMELDRCRVSAASPAAYSSSALVPDRRKQLFCWHFCKPCRGWVTPGYRYRGF